MMVSAVRHPGEKVLFVIMLFNYLTSPLRTTISTTPTRLKNPPPAVRIREDLPRSLRQTSKQANKQTSKQANKQTSKQANKQTSKQANKQTSKQANKQTIEDKGPW
jgi:hypothetical protein